MIHCRNILRDPKRLIVLFMAISFAVSYLPVTDNWLISFKGRTNLSALVISAMAVKKVFGTKNETRELAGSLNLVFNELKIATGQVRPVKEQKNGPVLLTEIHPEYPLSSNLSSLSADFGTGQRVPDLQSFYQSIILSPDPPPPEILS
ncbi:hypothetical protein [Desulfobacter latus]|uniref:Uncharacterized protein n=1 Tax=Desulfobacter latus TaxID=2292 RepID=A0A850SWD5_9BACT|nr:hypothetical protein [Desulfobacter latus]NWH05644.1 hypothetical protein [Desulfobacter latus]